MRGPVLSVLLVLFVPLSDLDFEVAFRPAGGRAFVVLDQDLGGLAEELGAELGLEVLVEVAEDAGSGP